MNIKQAFTKLTEITSKGMRNPFYVMRNLNAAFANIASDLDDSSKVFIDVSNVIKGVTSFKDTVTYTATENCYISLYIVGRNGADGGVTIDNANVGGFHINGVTALTLNYYLKSGQSIKVTGADTTYESGYRVYGLM